MYISIHSLESLAPNSGPRRGFPMSLRMCEVAWSKSWQSYTNSMEMLFVSPQQAYLSFIQRHGQISTRENQGNSFSPRIPRVMANGCGLMERPISFLHTRPIILGCVACLSQRLRRRPLETRRHWCNWMLISWSSNCEDELTVTRLKRRLICPHGWTGLLLTLLVISHLVNLLAACRKPNITHGLRSFLLTWRQYQSWLLSDSSLGLTQFSSFWCRGLWSEHCMIISNWL